MTAREHIECAILLADIAGSTRLYEDLGDQRAQEVISLCLHELSNDVLRHGGAVVKTVGDELMARFPSADDAVMAACTMQETTGAMGEETTIGVHSLSIHVGLHFGPAILDQGDIYGDAVNVAARMKDLARARQIITTQDTAERLSDELHGKTRRFDRTPVKGKQNDLVIYEVLWDEGEDLTGMGEHFAQPASGSGEIRLRFRKDEAAFDPTHRTIVLGRGKQCDFIVASKLASRQHARIEHRRGKFVLVDQSTNGTFVRTQDGKEVFLRREELPLWGTGAFSLGQSVGSDEDELVFFLCL